MRKHWFCLAALVTALAFGASLQTLVARAFVGHMGVHMILVAICAPLFAISFHGTAVDVSRHWQATSTLLLSLIELVVIWAWHFPAIRQAAETSSAVRTLELVSFLTVATLFWLACMNSAPRQGGTLAGIGALLLTSMHMTLLGVLLTMAPRALYGGTEVTCLGLTLTPLEDQQLGGILMLLVGAASYLVGALILLGRQLANADRWQERRS
ncbi:hypothetical protein LPJGGPFB_05140 [Ensifer adhaerens]|uniref:cytochrome c oxidase assembly protein n=1 Tax=Ensifer adhaerens TaxID=106592 RepID=UPI00156848AE|nr:cytochrome c oxidase assembly protein [Ensifer adhaerens]NRP21881.1 hypothetical protein [Ensifer adhaerens]